MKSTKNVKPQKIDHFLDNVGYWDEIEYLTDGLSENEMQEVSKEVEKIVASIRKRYNI